jgi:hypothetical protein
VPNQSRVTDYSTDHRPNWQAQSSRTIEQSAYLWRADNLFLFTSASSQLSRNNAPTLRPYCRGRGDIRHSTAHPTALILPLPHLNRPSEPGQGGRSVLTMTVFSPWRVKLFTLVLIWTPISVQGITVTVPLTASASAPLLSRSLVSFSIEQDRWGDWVGQGAGNPFFFNTLDNLKQLTGEPARIRIGANSEDRTNFNPSVQVRLYFSSGRRK